MNLQFVNLSYEVTSCANHFGIGKKKKKILKELNGHFKAGELTAIMGPSGAGKSSLLNAISGYVSAGVSGDLLVNSKPSHETQFKKKTCYITQEDVHQPLMTVKEVMILAANLKIPSRVSYENKLKTISEILTTLGLSQTQNTRTELLSGGEKKRLSIALELISNPPAFFLDEPTSGLDNVSTLQCVKVLKRISQQGRLVACTIHQPSASLLQLFDNVYIVADGLCVYQGSFNEIVPFLSSLGVNCPTNYNPAEYLSEIIDGNTEAVKLLSCALNNGAISRRGPPKLHSSTDSEEVRHSANGFDKNSAHIHENGHNHQSSNGISKIDYVELTYKHICSLQDRESYMTSTDIYASTTIPESSQSDYPISYWNQFCIIYKRMLQQILRNTVSLKIQLAYYIMCGFLVGNCFYDKAANGVHYFNHFTLTVACITFFTFNYVMVPTLNYPIQIRILRKEYFNRWYAVQPYYMALMISTIPFQIIFGMMFITQVYLLTGEPLEFLRFSLYSFVSILVGYLAEGIGFIMGSVFNITNGSVMCPVIMTPVMLLAVYGVDYVRKIHWLLLVLAKFSYMRHAAIALFIIKFGMNRSMLNCEDIYCHFQNPKFILYELDILDTPLWLELVYLLSFTVLFRIICYIIIKYRVT